MEFDCNSENVQTFIYLNEIKNNFNELKLLDIKINNKELYNKNRMNRIVETSEFYFEYDENNINYIILFIFTFFILNIYFLFKIN